MMSEHQTLLKKALFVLSSRIKLSSKSQPGFQELLKYVVAVSCVLSVMLYSLIPVLRPLQEYNKLTK